MHQTLSLQRMASTHGGMRKLLKQKPSPVQFIKWSVETGIHKDLHQQTDKSPRMRGRDGQQQQSRKPNFVRYPIEYEILSLNPPIPEPPRIPKKMLRKEKTSLPTDKLIKSYMRRYDARMKASSIITDAEREDYYYRKTLGMTRNGDDGQDLSTAMGRKSAVLSDAYDFALKQFQVMQDNKGMTEEESISVVEEILAQEEKLERLTSRERVRTIVKECEEPKDTKVHKVDTKDQTITSDTAAAPFPPPTLTIPSFLYSKPRTIQALNIWGKRLKAVPYNQWTLGASTALDHWIAVDVLGMSEETWDRLLRGELEVDVEKSRGVQLHIGDLARHRDISMVRSTLFPETLVEDVMDVTDDEDMLENDDEMSEKDATERSIDELLASLGGYDNNSGGKSGDDVSNENEDMNSRISKMIDSLQDWRAKNQELPYDQWENSTKESFNIWLADYINLVSSEMDGQVDLKATREALLSEPPRYRDEAEAFWSQLSDETDAEIFLHHLTKQGAPSKKEGESSMEKRIREDFETFLSLPYSKQLSQLISLGTLRPILDEYCSEEERLTFIERYGETILEGMEIEHLVSDPNGTITVDDIGDDDLISKQDIVRDQRFSIQMIPYGTDEFGLRRSEKARALYRAWNMHKSGRARYAEIMFKAGKMPLQDSKQ
eukprot:CAMPEP_0176490124 /NCGR_PEP_ID=MMETSP0200_2-20121128/7695_1 /TAXON_ID=947934 /ORGANISM="Chaetoceros sp., Strain GSL56" /LENGTH=660 /DNA_ID=CAMNT_0017887393 /DNA_START=14 /DNA_END=1996 /DNA_ORIENTATION=-